MKKAFPFIILIILWQLLAMTVNRTVIVPYPIDVLNTMLQYGKDISFYQSVGYTLLRIVLGFICSSFIGISLAFISYHYQNMEAFLSPLVAFFQTIPQISYIIILLVWFNNTTALMIIIIFMLFPIFYTNCYNGLKGIDSDLKDVIILYHHTAFFNIKNAYLPLIKHHINAAIDTCIPLSIKVGVMSEIFVSSTYGIGKQLYLARINIDTTAIFALTFDMVIIIQVLLFLFHFYQRKRA